jgi:hypothetical protein
MERASTGAEVNVSRRGRPYVRMCGACATLRDRVAAADE